MQKIIFYPYFSLFKENFLTFENISPDRIRILGDQDLINKIV